MLAQTVEITTQSMVVLGMILGVIWSVVRLGDRLWKPKSSQAITPCHIEHLDLENHLTTLAKSVISLSEATKANLEIAKMRHDVVLREFGSMHKRMDRLEDKK